MSTKFFGKLATGIALGSAALLLTAPGLAAADDKFDFKRDKQREVVESASGIEQSRGSSFNTAINQQGNKAIAHGKTAIAINVPIQIVTDGLFPVLDGASAFAECWLSLDLETRLLLAEQLVLVGDLQDLVQWFADVLAACENDIPENGNGVNGNGNGGILGQARGSGVVPVGSVAAGDGGALMAASTGGVAVAGIGMLGLAALGGTALLRQRSADDSVA